MSNSVENKNNLNLDEILESSFSDLNKELDELDEELQKQAINSGEDNKVNDENDEEEDEEEDDDYIELTFDEIIPVINQKYINAISNLNSLFKHHKELGPSIKNDIAKINAMLNEDKYHVLNVLTDNYLYCLEQVKDLNADFFIYQEVKKIKRKGKITKTKLSKIGEKTSLKEILPNLKTKTSQIFFKDIFEIFELLVYEDENGTFNFNEDYLEFVKENFSNNNNYNKIILVIENIDAIFSNYDENEIDEQINQSILQENKENEDKKNKKNKKNKKSSSEGFGNLGENLGENFMKGIEDTKIATLAKNISEKINLTDFPVLNDPSKLLSSLTNPGQQGEDGKGIGDLLQFVIGEVQEAFKGGNGLSENDLVNEAQNIMGKFGNMAGFDPSKMMNNPNLNLNQFADIFASMTKK
jgi:hypothetical protein